ncbi:condensation domain-containing protein [Streptomyces sp. NRRL WC-3742]|uniref:condensation domain-containing protein n=1 Tax=Streptomyces sp. NRRL WC-3742 TaxID=1463934 RepID=UPI000AF7DD78|nr:condensation domain-containing protein [Streptomyces sp. NRRL WC-3742]
MTIHDVSSPDVPVPSSPTPAVEAIPLATRRIAVRYAAEGSGFGPLTRGQDNMIRCIRGGAPEQINKDSVWPVPDDTSLSAGLDALRLLVERHESLRTHFPPGPGPDGFPDRQVVRANGEFTVTVIEAGGRTDAELDALAEESGRRDVAVPIDLAAPPRIRFTLLAEGERLLRLVAVVCHAGADGAAIAVLIQDWLALAAGKELPPVSAPTPLEFAAAEQSPQGRRKATAALRRWAQILSTGPQAVFADSRITGRASDHGALLVRSREGADDLAAVCRRTGASPSVVLLAGFAALVAHRSGQSRLVLAALSANRQRAALLDHVGTLAQDALIELDLEGAPEGEDGSPGSAPTDLDGLIGRTKPTSLAAYWHSTLDAEKVWELVEDTAHLRGARFGRQVVVNDLSLTIPAAVADLQPAPAVEPELTELPSPPMPVRLMFTILRISGSLDFVLVACPQVLDAQESDHFARALLAVLAAAAKGPVPLAELPGLADLPRPHRVGEWHVIDGCWIDLAAVRALLREALGPEAEIRLALEDAALTAEITTPDASLTPGVAHVAVVAALPGRDTAMAPHHYLIRHRRSGTVAEGSGRDPEVAARHAALTRTGESTPS